MWVYFSLGKSWSLGLVGPIIPKCHAAHTKCTGPIVLLNRSDKQ